MTSKRHAIASASTVQATAARPRKPDTFARRRH